MKQRIFTLVVIIPLFITLSTTPAHALLGSILAGIQRAQMIFNQGIQIYKDTMVKITFDGQLTEMVQQATHLKEQALGRKPSECCGPGATSWYQAEPDQARLPCSMRSSNFSPMTSG